jgi:N-acetylglucosamine kinase-like BadF-type ATPase
MTVCRCDGECSLRRHICCGVDAGGTRTAAVAYSPQGERLAACEAGPGNGTAGGNQAIENILSAVRGCMAAVAGPCIHVVVGMAGLDPAAAPSLREAFQQNLGVPCGVVSDGELALYAAHGGGDGLLVVAGTGSIAYGKRGDTVLRRGGWGHILGDRGSAYAIAADAIRMALDDVDDGLPEHPLTQALLQAAGVGRLRALVERAYNTPKADTAVLAQAVAERAAQGDRRAADILARAGRELAAMALALSARLGLESPAVALSGGVLAHVPAVRDSFCAHLAAALPQAVVSDQYVEPQRGALYLHDR